MAACWTDVPEELLDHLHLERNIFGSSNGRCLQTHETQTPAVEPWRHEVIAAMHTAVYSAQRCEMVDARWHASYTSAKPHRSNTTRHVRPVDG